MEPSIAEVLRVQPSDVHAMIIQGVSKVTLYFDKYNGITKGWFKTGKYLFQNTVKPL